MMPFFPEDDAVFETVPIHFEVDDGNDLMIPLGHENVPMGFMSEDNQYYNSDNNNMIHFGNNPYQNNMEMYNDPRMYNNPYIQNSDNVRMYGPNTQNRFKFNNPYIPGTLYPGKFSEADPYIHNNKIDMNYDSMGYEDPYEYLERKFNDYNNPNSFSNFMYQGINDCAAIGYPSDECLNNIPYGYNRDSWRIEAEKRALFNKARYLGFDSIDEYQEALRRTEIYLFKVKCKFNNSDYTDEQIDDLVNERYFHKDISIEDKMQRTIDDAERKNHHFEVQVIIDGEVIIDTKRDGSMGERQYTDWNRVSRISEERHSELVRIHNYNYDHAPERILDKYDNIQEILDNYYKVNLYYLKSGITFKAKRDKKLIDRARYKKKMDFLRILSEYGKLNERIKISDALNTYDPYSDPYNPDYEPLIGWTINDDSLQRARDWISEGQSLIDKLKNGEDIDDNSLPVLESDYKNKFILSAKSKGGKVIELE